MLVASRDVFAAMLVALLAAGGIAAPVPADRQKAERELAALAVKCEGSWQGTVGCQGDLTLRANGTYEWKYRGPGGDTDTGIWAVRTDGLGFVLILKCKTSDNPEREGKTVEGKLFHVDGESFSFLNAEKGGPSRFERPEAREKRK